MYNGRHRKSTPHTLARRTALSAGAAAVALLASVAGAPAASASSDAVPTSVPAFADPVPGIPPLPCTGSPLDASTTCAGGGHYGKGGNAGDGTGDDTPILGGGGGGGADNPPAGQFR